MMEVRPYNHLPLKNLFTHLLVNKKVSPLTTIFSWKTLIQKTLDILMCLDSSTNTKKNKENNKGNFKSLFICGSVASLPVRCSEIATPFCVETWQLGWHVTCYMSHVTCYMSHNFSFIKCYLFFFITCYMFHVTCNMTHIQLHITNIQWYLIASIGCVYIWQGLGQLGWRPHLPITVL